MDTSGATARAYWAATKAARIEEVRMMVSRKEWYRTEKVHVQLRGIEARTLCVFLASCWIQWRVIVDAARAGRLVASSWRMAKR